MKVGVQKNENKINNITREQYQNIVKEEFASMLYEEFGEDALDQGLWDKQSIHPHYDGCEARLVRLP